MTDYEAMIMELEAKKTALLNRMHALEEFTEGLKEGIKRAQAAGIVGPYDGDVRTTAEPGLDPAESLKRVRTVPRGPYDRRGKRKSGKDAEARPDRAGSAPVPEFHEIPEIAYAGMSCPAAIRAYLGSIKREQGTIQIADALVDGGFKSKSKHFPNIVYQTLLRLSRTGKDIKRIGSHTWKLRGPYDRRGKRKSGKDVGARTDLGSYEAQ